MSNGLNQVNLIGNLGADPELRMTSGGTAVLNMRLATSEPYKKRDSDKWEEHTEWHRLTMWGKRAESLAKIVEKGHRVAIVGRLRTSSYENKDGVTMYTTEIRVDNVVLCERAPGGRTQREAPDDVDIPVTVDDDDIPF